MQIELASYSNITLTPTATIRKRYLSSSAPLGVPMKTTGLCPTYLLNTELRWSPVSYFPPLFGAGRAGCTQFRDRSPAELAELQHDVRGPCMQGTYKGILQVLVDAQAGRTSSERNRHQA